MKLEGGCYCGDLRYTVEGEPMFKGVCHCRECQYISGGAVNVVMAMPETGFSYTRGEPSAFTRSDLENAVTREFCGRCGTHTLTRVPAMPGMVMMKVGTLDDPSVFGTPQMAIFGVDRQPFHQLLQGAPTYERGPGSTEIAS